MEIRGGEFVVQRGVDYQVTSQIDPTNLKTNLIRSIYDRATNGGCGGDEFTHLKLVFANFNAVIEPLG